MGRACSHEMIGTYVLRWREEKLTGTLFRLRSHHAYPSYGACQFLVPLIPCRCWQKPEWHFSGSACIPSIGPYLKRKWKLQEEALRSGKTVVKWNFKHFDDDAFENAIDDSSMQARRIHVLLHLPSIAYELGLEIRLSSWYNKLENTISVNVKPSGNLSGRYAHLAASRQLWSNWDHSLHLDAMTVTEKQWSENLDEFFMVTMTMHKIFWHRYF